jgi:hypothetical protein
VWLMNSLHQSPYRWVRLYEKFPQSIGTTLRETAQSCVLDFSWQETTTTEKL